jgi:hypothetical protein
LYYGTLTDRVLARCVPRLQVQKEIENKMQNRTPDAGKPLLTLESARDILGKLVQLLAPSNAGTVGSSSILPLDFERSFEAMQALKPQVDAVMNDVDELLRLRAQTATNDACHNQKQHAAQHVAPPKRRRVSAAVATVAKDAMQSAVRNAAAVGARAHISASNASTHYSAHDSRSVARVAALHHFGNECVVAAASATPAVARELRFVAAAAHAKSIDTMMHATMMKKTQATSALPSSSPLPHPSEARRGQPGVGSSEYYGAFSLRMLERLKALFDIYKEENVHRIVDMVKASMDPPDKPVVEHRREAMWNAFNRSVAVSGDRLLRFLRHLSGAIGAETSDLFAEADESIARSAKRIAEQRLAVAKRVADTQSKIIEIVFQRLCQNSDLGIGKGLVGDNNSGGLATSATGSNDADIGIVDTEIKKQIKELQSGTASTPYFEAAVSSQFLERSAKVTSIEKLIETISFVGRNAQQQLEETLLGAGDPAALPGFSVLGSPENALFVRLRADTMSAIRDAAETINVELAMHGCRRIHLWEFVESGCDLLSHRFATFAATLLVRSRNTTGVSASYVSMSSMALNSHFARDSFQKCLNVAIAYATAVATPSFNGQMDSRKRAINSASEVKESGIYRPMKRHKALLPNRSGWYVRYNQLR